MPQALPSRPGFVVGLAAEARIAAHRNQLVAAGGGRPEGALSAAQTLLAQGADALVSFGLAGGLHPDLRPGMLLIASRVLHDSTVIDTDAELSRRFGEMTLHTLLAGRHVVADPVAKRALHHATGADAVDLESGAVAHLARARGVPFAAVRAICDPAERGLPHAALIALDHLGGVRFPRIVMSVMQQPAQLGDLVRLARDAALARATLVRVMGVYTGKPRGGGSGY